MHRNIQAAPGAKLRHPIFGKPDETVDLKGRVLQTPSPRGISHMTLATAEDYVVKIAARPCGLHQLERT